MQSIYTSSCIQDWYKEDKLWSKAQQCSSRLWIQWTRNIKIQMKLTWMHHVLLGPNLKVRKNLWARGLSSIWKEGNLLRTLTHQVSQSGMFTRICLFKRGNLTNWWKFEWWDLLLKNLPVLLAQHTDRFIANGDIMTLTPSQNQTCR